jgi:hypothetical protein
MENMSNERSRFKIKKGETEIEYEGPSAEVRDRYKEAFEWVKSARPKISEEKKPDQKTAQQEVKKGGARRALFSPKIDELISEEFFKLPNKRKVPDVLKALMEKGLPTTGKDKAVLIALKRRLGKTLKGTKEQGEWVFWTD